MTSPVADTSRGADGQRRNDQAAKQLRPGPGLLVRAQLVDRTATGVRITPGHVPLMRTVAEQEQKVANARTPDRVRTLLSEPFNQVSIITECIGLTGVGGLVLERIKHSFPDRPLRCLLNVTVEAPRFTFGDAESYRIPVQDDQKENLGVYFEEATAKLEEICLKGDGICVVHCLVGISRSASVVMAYLIRYKDMSLEQSFRHVKAVRPIISPNLAFLNQLASFELKCRNEHPEQCSPWAEHTENGISKRLPSFIIAEYLEDYDHEFEVRFGVSKPLID